MTKFGTPVTRAGPGSASKKVGFWRRRGAVRVAQVGCPSCASFARTLSLSFRVRLRSPRAPCSSGVLLVGALLAARRSCSSWSRALRSVRLGVGVSASSACRRARAPRAAAGQVGDLDVLGRSWPGRRPGPGRDERAAVETHHDGLRLGGGGQARSASGCHGNKCRDKQRVKEPDLSSPVSMSSLRPPRAARAGRGSYQRSARRATRYLVNSGAQRGTVLSHPWWFFRRTHSSS